MIIIINSLITGYFEGMQYLRSDKYCGAKKIFFAILRGIRSTRNEICNCK